jgi:creatinine amidohydrolase
VAPAPDGTKQPIDSKRLQSLPPAQARELAGDGNFGGAYEKPDEDMLRIWQVAVEETRGMIDEL